MDNITWADFTVFIPVFIIALVLIVIKLPELDQLLSGEDVAITRGVNVKKTKILLIIASSLMTGIIVALCGPIGFIGIMGPHTCRMLFPLRHKITGLTSFITGSIILIICDTVARVAASPSDIPVGIITSLLGGPFFLWILFNRSQKAYC